MVSSVAFLFVRSFHFPFWEEEEGLTGSTEDEDGGRGGHDVGVDFLGGRCGWTAKERKGWS